MRRVQELFAPIEAVLAGNHVPVQPGNADLSAVRMARQYQGDAGGVQRDGAVGIVRQHEGGARGRTGHKEARIVLAHPAIPQPGDAEATHGHRPAFDDLHAVRRQRRTQLRIDVGAGSLLVMVAQHRVDRLLQGLQGANMRSSGSPPGS